MPHHRQAVWGQPHEKLLGVWATLTRTKTPPSFIKAARQRPHSVPLTGAVLTVSAGAGAAGASRNPATMPLDALPAIAVPSSGSLRRAVAAVACRSFFRACPYRRAVCCPPQNADTK